MSIARWVRHFIRPLFYRCAAHEAALLAGRVIMARTQRLDWWHDPADPFAFHAHVPAGVAELDITFQHLPALNGPKSLTPALLMLQWQKVALYPAGTVTVGYAGGLRYPRLARIPGSVDRLARSRKQWCER
jgi:hypothetical protein